MWRWASGEIVCAARTPLMSNASTSAGTPLPRRFTSPPLRAAYRRPLLALWFVDVRALPEKHLRALHQRLRERRVRVNHELHVFGRRTHLDRQRAFGNQLACAGTRNADTEHASGLGFEHQLGQPFGTVHSDRTTERPPRELRDLELDLLRLRLRL